MRIKVGDNVVLYFDSTEEPIMIILDAQETIELIKEAEQLWLESTGTNFHYASIPPHLKWTKDEATKWMDHDDSCGPVKEHKPN